MPARISPHGTHEVRDAPFAALDFESAGAGRGQTDQVVQIGVAVCTGLDWSTLRMFRSYVRPEGKVAWMASRVHGIEMRTVENAPLYGDLWPVLRELLSERMVVAHGAATEKRYLRRFPLHGFGPWVDTLPIARSCCPGAASHRLGDIVAEIGGEQELRTLVPTLNWHDALFDAVAALVLLRRTVESRAGWDLPARRLMDLCRLSSS